VNAVTEHTAQVARAEGFFVGTVCGLLLGVVIVLLAYSVPW
jgi:uncharacterized membrane protein YccC